MTPFPGPFPRLCESEEGEQIVVIFCAHGRSKASRAMTEWMPRAQLLHLIAEEQRALEEVLRPLAEQDMLRRGVYDVLSVKDVLAHLTAWEQLEIGWIQASLRGETPVRFLPGFELGSGDRNALLDRLNEYFYQLHKDRLLADVLDDFRATHQAVLDVVGALSEDDLNDPHRFDWWDGEPVWTSIAGNTYGHLREHRELIKAWLKVTK